MAAARPLFRVRARVRDNGGLNVSVNIHRPHCQAAKRSRWVSVIYAVTAVAEYSQISVWIRAAREPDGGAFMSVLKLYCRSECRTRVRRKWA